MIHQLLGNIRTYQASAGTNTRIKKYLKSGRKPWTKGYKEHKKAVLRDILGDEKLLDCFLHNRDLTANYGFRLDERVIEYPWVLARLGVAKH